MTYVKTNASNQVEAYPYSLHQLRKDNPNTSFPKNPPDWVLAEWGVYSVTNIPVPQHDNMTQLATRDAAPAFVDGAWVIGWAVEDRPLDGARARMIDALRAWRNQAVYAGITYLGYPIATDDLTQQRITSAALSATVDPTVDFKWKVADGRFAVFTAAEMLALSRQMRDYIQLCFVHEANLLSDIEAATTTAELRAIDITANWPG